MLDGVPRVIHAIRMIHTVSRKYNTSERMTSLFVKVHKHAFTCSLVQPTWCTYVRTYVGIAMRLLYYYSVCGLDM